MLKILYFVYGACLASFLTLCAARIVTHQSIIVPRSHCDQCNRQLRNWQLIPILGYIMQHGRCHFCHKLISAFSTINEIALGLFFTTLPQYELTPSLAWICISSTLTFCAATDQFQHFIYSPSLIGFVPGLLILVRWNGFSLQNWLLLLATLLILGFFVLVTHGIGFGDVELIILFQLISGFTVTMVVLAISSSVAILYFVVMKHKGQLAFVPFLSFSFLFVVSFPNLFTFIEI